MSDSATENQATENQATENQATENQATENQATENQATEQQDQMAPQEQRQAASGEAEARPELEVKNEAENKVTCEAVGQEQETVVIKTTEKSVSVGTSTVIETQEVVSSTSTTSQAKGSSARKDRSSARERRGSYQAGRGYAGSFQNYGLTYLPYKSNFEPSEDARRRADEFLKTLKL